MRRDLTERDQAGGDAVSAASPADDPTTEPLRRAWARLARPRRAARPGEAGSDHAGPSGAGTSGAGPDQASRGVSRTGGARRARLLVGGLRRVAALWLFVALVVVWWVWSADSTSTFFPPLKDIVHRLYELWITGDAKKNLASSLQNFALGYLVAGVAGVAVGALLWMMRSARDAVSPFLYFLYVLPAPVLIPAAMTIFGIGSAMKVVIIAFAAVWPTLLNTLDGMRGVDPLKLDNARVLGMSGFRVVRSVVLPAALPQIVAGLRNSLQVAIILMVVSELVASTSGIGFFILNAQQSFAFVDMWTGIIVLALIGSVLNLLFVLIESRILFWHYGARATGEKG